MPILKNPSTWINNCPPDLSIKKTKQKKRSTVFDKGSSLAFSGDLKHWMSKQKNKPLF